MANEGGSPWRFRLGRLRRAAFYDGSTRTEAAKIGGVGLQIIRDWDLRFNARPDGLLNGKALGQPSKFHDAQRRAIAQAVESDPIPAIHGVVRWRLVDPTQRIFEEFRTTIAKQMLSREPRPWAIVNYRLGHATMRKPKVRLILLRELPRALRIRTRVSTIAGADARGPDEVIAYAHSVPRGRKVLQPILLAHPPAQATRAGLILRPSQPLARFQVRKDPRGPLGPSQDRLRRYAQPKKQSITAANDCIGTM